MRNKRSGPTSAASKNKYRDKAYDTISVFFPKGERDGVKAAADAAGQSMNAYIKQAIAERMEREI